VDPGHRAREEDRAEEAGRARAPGGPEDVHGDDAGDAGESGTQPEAELRRTRDEKAGHLGQETDDGHGHEARLEDAREPALHQLEGRHRAVDEVEVDVLRDVEEAVEMRHARRGERNDDRPVDADGLPEAHAAAERGRDHPDDERVERDPEAGRIGLGRLRGAPVVEEGHARKERDAAREEREKQAPVLRRRGEDGLPVGIPAPRRDAVPERGGEREAEAREERHVAARVELDVEIEDAAARQDERGEVQRERHERGDRGEDAARERGPRPRARSGRRVGGGDARLERRPAAPDEHGGAEGRAREDEERELPRASSPATRPRARARTRPRTGRARGGRGRPSGRTQPGGA